MTESATVTMPVELTAECGAKAALIGEFFETVTEACLDCLYEGNNSDCPRCDGTGTVTRQIPVSWTTIKAIYSKAVEKLGWVYFQYQGAAPLNTDHYTAAIQRGHPDTMQSECARLIDRCAKLSAELEHRDRQIADLTAACQEQQRIITETAKT